MIFLAPADVERLTGESGERRAFIAGMRAAAEVASCGLYRAAGKRIRAAADALEGEK